MSDMFFDAAMILRVLSSPALLLATSILGQVVALLRLVVGIAWLLQGEKRPRVSVLSWVILVGTVLLNAARLYEAQRIAREWRDKG